MINLKTPGTIYDKYENPRYHLWYIWKPQVKTRGTISCQVFVSKCYFVTKFVTEHVAKHATCFVSKLFCVSRYHLWYVWKPQVPFMIHLKTPGTIYGTLENPKYYLWYIWRPHVKTRGTISCQVFVSKCYFVTKFVTKHVAKHATCFVSKLFCVSRYHFCLSKKA
jgi:hypothetical protein